jgi:hypothetical protein
MRKFKSGFIIIAATGLLLAGTASHAGKPEWAGNKGGKGKKADYSEVERERGERSEKRKEKHKEKREKYSDEVENERHYQKSRSDLSEWDQLKVREYYRDREFDGDRNKKYKKKKLPYGLQKKLERGGELPQGWQNKVAKGEVLGGELLERSVRVPEELIRRLPELRDGSEYRRLGDKVVRVLGGNGTVVDVIDLADEVLYRRHNR